MEQEWILWLGGAAAVVTSVSIIWTRALSPAAHTIKRIWAALRRMTDAWDVLYEISEQFKPNGGTTVHDRISRLETQNDDMIHQLEHLAVWVNLPRNGSHTHEPGTDYDHTHEDDQHRHRSPDRYVDPDDIGGAPV